MTHIITPTSVRPRHVAFVSAPLAIVAFTAISPSIASASSGDGRCESGEFCLGYYYNLLYDPSQGTYDNPYANDAKLSDNYAFVPNWGQGGVDNNTWSLANKKTADVVVFDGDGYDWGGPGGCIHAGRAIHLPDGWKDRISSWKVVSRSVCHQYPILAGG